MDWRPKVIPPISFSYQLKLCWLFLKLGLTPHCWALSSVSSPPPLAIISMAPSAVMWLHRGWCQRDFSETHYLSKPWQSSSAQPSPQRRVLQLPRLTTRSPSSLWVSLLRCHSPGSQIQGQSGFSCIRLPAHSRPRIGWHDSGTWETFPNGTPDTIPTLSRKIVSRLLGLSLLLFRLLWWVRAHVCLVYVSNK